MIFHLNTNCLRKSLASQTLTWVIIRRPSKNWPAVCSKKLKKSHNWKIRQSNWKMWSIHLRRIQAINWRICKKKTRRLKIKMKIWRSSWNKSWLCVRTSILNFLKSKQNWTKFLQITTNQNFSLVILKRNSKQKNKPLKLWIQRLVKCKHRSIMLLMRLKESRILHQGCKRTKFKFKKSFKNRQIKLKKVNLW